MVSYLEFQRDTGVVAAAEVAYRSGSREILVQFPVSVIANLSTRRGSEVTSVVGPKTPRRIAPAS